MNIIPLENLLKEKKTECEAYMYSARLDQNFPLLLVQVKSVKTQSTFRAHAVVCMKGRFFITDNLHDGRFSAQIFHLYSQKHK